MHGYLAFIITVECPSFPFNQQDFTGRKWACLDLTTKAYSQHLMSNQNVWIDLPLFWVF